MTQHGKKLFTARVSAREHSGHWTERYEIVKQGTLELVLDVDKLIEAFGRKALSNHTKRATAMKGAIVAKVHSVTEERIRT